MKRKVTCRSFLEEMSEYFDGDLTNELRVSLETHLARCPNCWVLFDETKRTVEIFQSYDCHPMPEGVKDRLMDALQSRWSPAESPQAIENKDQ